MIKLILFIVAFTLFIITFPIAVIYTALDTVFTLLGNLALAIDTAGNVLLAELFNDFLITKKGYKFGNRKETISSVLGKNERDNTLKIGGRLLCSLLNKIDINHCKKAIDTKI